MVKIQILLVCSIAMLASQCNTSKKNTANQTQVTQLPQAAIEDFTWMITKADTIDFSKLEPRKMPVIILHQKGKNFSGTSGCNSILGNYVIDKGTLTFDQLSSTEMFCAGLMDAEYALLRSLRSVKTYTATDTTCIFLSSEHKALVSLIKIKK